MTRWTPRPATRPARGVTTAALLSALYGAACSGSCGGPSAVRPPPSAKEAHESATTTAKPAQPEAKKPPPALVLELEPVARGERRSLTLSLRNRDAEPVAVRGQLRLQRRAGERFSDVEGARATLRSSCEQPAERCVTLWPGAELLPPPVGGPDACDCEGCGDLQAGTYRAVALGCEGEFEIASNAVSLVR